MSTHGYPTRPGSSCFLMASAALRGFHSRHLDHLASLLRPSSLYSANDIRQKVVSPILFVDCHVAVHDFTKAVKSPWPAEANADCVWYNPLREGGRDRDLAD